jgi:hypothetical protein
MRLAGSLILLALGCLDAPPGGIGDGDGDGGVEPSDGPATSSDASAGCARDLSLDFDSTQDIADWIEVGADGCSVMPGDVGLEFSNDGTIATCRVLRDRILDLSGNALAVRLLGGDARLSMTFTVAIGPADVPFGDRRWIYFKRDNGDLFYGECNEEFAEPCDDDHWGSVEYTPSEQAWLRFRHQPRTDRLVFEVSGDGKEYAPQAEVAGILSDMVTCVGVELGSYERDDIGSPTAASFKKMVTQ